MAKRELYEKKEVISKIGDNCLFYSCRTLHPITEEEIVKPYLEKLNEHIINFPWGDTSDGFMTGVNAVYNLIDNLLTERGAEE